MEREKKTNNKYDQSKAKKNDTHLRKWGRSRWIKKIWLKFVNCELDPKTRFSSCMFQQLDDRLFRIIKKDIYA